MKAFDRLLQYVKINTVSHEDREGTPSTACQRELAVVLEKEMKDMGMSEVFLDSEHAYVYGKVPVSKGCEKVRPIGFIAHLDIVDDLGEGQVHPQVIPCWQGEPIRLGNSGKMLEPGVMSGRDMRGMTLMTTDGTTVLGADDKAGIAEILTACEELMKGEIPHGPVSVCFVPDEEIGHGAALLDLERFGAFCAYTADGSAPEELEFETFNAAKAVWEIQGISVHPGMAKDKMVNASLTAVEIASLLPADEVPARTDGREGFYHLTSMEGNVSSARLSYILRDHDAARLEQRKETMRSIEAEINKKYGKGTAVLTITDQYRNMAEVIQKYPEVLEAARNAICRAGLTPVSNPVRGGTDGAQLSFRGLPCPNLGTGCYGFHGPYEFAVAEEMEQSVGILLNIVSEWAVNGDSEWGQ